MRRLIALIILASMAGPVASDTIPARADQYRRTLTRYAQIHLGMTAPVALFGAQIHQESAWRPNAKSKYAAGLAQFTGPTAGDMGRWYRHHLGETNVYSPDWALQALVLYNKRLWNYIGNRAAGECDRWAMTLAGYNGGVGHIDREIRLCMRDDDCDERRWWGNVETHCRRADWACRENRDYPRKIIFRWQPLYQAAGWGGPTICEEIQ